MVRVCRDGSGREAVVNTWRRAEEEEAGVGGGAGGHGGGSSLPFYCRMEARQKAAKVGYTSTLHTNYDAFAKDTSWFCAFCRRYSHAAALGDLYGPYFLQGPRAILKKSFPNVVEGQVVEAAPPAPPPAPQDAAAHPAHPQAPQRVKKRTPRRESASDALPLPKPEQATPLQSLRFVPAATPARMLGRTSSHPGLASPTSTTPPTTTTGTTTTTTTTPVLEVKPEPSIPTSGASHHPGVLEHPSGTECWVHEACLVWAPGVHVSNSKLCGLEEAVTVAQDSVCQQCQEGGATVGCLGKGCTSVFTCPLRCKFEMDS
ncbi:hypothetical protein O3P69_019641 [Scylla paramamosain]|uniref:PHD-type domain-containing protein n=1 Tax=Scylla paramamosain TaxID=85552 RepID=A0AAW0SXQ8_SCYPA